MKRAIVAFLKDETGASTIEYIVGAAVMALLAAGVYTKLKDKINTAADTTGTAIDDAIDMASQ